MTTGNIDNTAHREAWKNVIEFSKVTIGFATSILTAYVSFLVLKDVKLSALILISPALLVLSFVLSLVGFGRAIRAIKKGESERIAIFSINVAAILLIVAVITIPFTQSPQKNSIDKILKEISCSTTTYQHRLDPSTCSKIEFTNGTYRIHYFVNDSVEVKVQYAELKGQVVSIEPGGK